MATDMARLIVSLEVREKQLLNALKKVNGTVNSQARAIEGRFAKMNARIGNSLTGVGKRWIAGLAAGISVNALKNLSDAATRIDNSLKVAGLSGADLEGVYERLRASAIKNAAPLEALTELYGRASLVQKELGITGEELLAFTDRIAVALRVSGKSASESSGALLQLSQALGSGTVRAEEFNSILEGALPIAQAAAVGLKEAGGSVAALRKLVVDGKVSSEAFFRAFEAGSVSLEEKVASSEFTIAQAMGNLQTSLIDSVREFNKATGASESFADGINNIATAISDFDMSGFIKQISDARNALERFLNDVGNSSYMEQFAEFMTGRELTVGQPINLDTVAAEDDLANLLRQVGILEDRIAVNKEMAIDTTEAQSQLATLLAMVSAAQGALAAPASRGYVSGTPGDPNALAQRATLGTASVKPVSLKDFKSPSGSDKGSKKKESEYAREIAQIKERTAALQAETAAQAGVNPLIDDYGFAVEKARAKQELLNAAQKAGIAVTPALEAQIETLADGYANATVAAGQLAESQDKVRENAEAMQALGKDVMGGFIRDMIDGKSATDALAGALSKVGDKLLDLALDSAFSTKGGGGGILSGILGMFGGGGFKPNTTAGKFFTTGFASGTANTGGARGQPRGVVHGQEAVVPLPNGGRIPVEIRAPRIPGSNGGGGVNLTYAPQIDARGADQAAVDRLERVMAKDRALFETRVVKTVREAQKTRQL